MDIHWLVQECSDPMTLQRLFYYERYSWLALSHDMAAVISMDGMFEDLNTHWEMVTGHSREAMQNSYLIEYIHFDDREKTLAELQALITADIASTSTTFRFRRDDGEFNTLHFNVIYSPDHEAYFCIARDIGKESDADKLAYTDALTGLPNRLALDKDLPETLGRAKDVGGGVAAMFIDLDGFKEVNDTLGHKAGDSLLMRAAQRMKECMDNEETVYRLAGDEFIILAPLNGEKDSATKLAKRVLESLSAPYRIEEDIVKTTASIGLALFPQDAGIPVALLDCADKAMYHVKRHGKSSFTFYEDLEQAAR